MGLFTSTKNPCPICGEATPRLLSTKIEGRPLCSKCANRMDMQSELQDTLTVDGLREHFDFLDRNRMLADSFIESKRINYGLFSTCIIFDQRNHLFCVGPDTDRTVFQKGELVSLSVFEDDSPLFLLNADGLMRYESTVMRRLEELAPEIRRASRIADLDRLNRVLNDDRSRSVGSDAPEPFKEFKVLLKFDHPYWKEKSFSLSAPDMDREYPSVEDYLRKYRSAVVSIEELVTAFMVTAFPDAPKAESAAPRAAGASAADPAEELRKYKKLLDDGVINEDDYAAKKKELLGL